MGGVEVNALAKWLDYPHRDWCASTLSEGGCTCGRDAAQAELEQLRRVASTAELISLEAQNESDSIALPISNNLLRDLADALKGTK